MHTWRNLVHHQALGCHEKLHPHHTDIVQRVEDLAGHQNRIGALCRAQACGQGGGAQDTAFVHILARVKTGHIARSTARPDHGHLVAEVDKSFKDRVLPGHAVQRLGRIAGLHDPRLALAVIAKAPGFQDRGQADLFNRGL